MIKSLDKFQELLKKQKESIKNLDKICDEGQTISNRRQHAIENREK